MLFTQSRPFLHMVVYPGTALNTFCVSSLRAARMSSAHGSVSRPEHWLAPASRRATSSFLHIGWNEM